VFTCSSVYVFTLKTRAHEHMSTKILNIDTTSTKCSIAISQDGQVLITKQGSDRQAAIIISFIKDVGLKLNEIACIALSSGPGSYTGLRIGAATAKGLCFALNKPLIKVDTMQAMALAAQRQYQHKVATATTRNVLYCPIIEARKNELYMAIYDENNQCLKLPYAQTVGSGLPLSPLKKGVRGLLKGSKKKIIVFTEDGLKYKDSFRDGNIIFEDKFNFSAANMAELSYKHFKEKIFEDIAYFEPFYLTEFRVNSSNAKL